MKNVTQAKSNGTKSNGTAKSGTKAKSGTTATDANEPRNLRPSTPGEPFDADAHLPRRPTDRDALCAVSSELDDLADDYATLFHAVNAVGAEADAPTLGCTMARLNSRLVAANLKLNEARGGQVIR